MSSKITRASGWMAGGLLFSAFAAGAHWFQSRGVPAVPTIAFIPQTAGAMLWEVEHLGATLAAEKLKCHLYWNAPTSETDVAGQVTLVDRVGRGNYQGLVLAPNHPLAILAPLRRAVAAGIPVIVVSAPLDLPASEKLGYIVNDDAKMGELAAAELARLLNGMGPIALVGLGRYAPGVTRRVQAAEQFLATRFPDIRVVSRLGGAYNTSRAEELTNGVVESHPELRGILSFNASSTRGVYSALKGRSLTGAISLVGCEQDFDLIAYLKKGEIAAILAEDTFRMGNEAVGLISASWTGMPIPAKSIVPPLLITRQNVNSAEARGFTSLTR